MNPNPIILNALTQIKIYNTNKSENKPRQKFIFRFYHVDPFCLTKAVKNKEKHTSLKIYHSEYITICMFFCQFKTGVPFLSVADSIICFIADINLFQR